MDQRFRIEIVPARDHLPDEYRMYFDGHRALRLFDGGELVGELVWRFGTGKCVEITEFGIFQEQKRRKGHGKTLMDAGLKDMKRFFVAQGHSLRRVYLFCESRNASARAFYATHGFTLAAELKDFYGHGFPDAAIFVLRLGGDDGKRAGTV